MNQCDHIELATDDPKTAVKFYAKLFGWKIAATPTPGGGPPYHMFRTGDRGGGITAKMNPQQPTLWMPYITVASVKATQKKAAALGGHAIPGFEYVPIGEMGAVGGFIDPTGAAIGLWEAGKPAKRPAAKKVSKARSKKVTKKKATRKKR